MHVKALSSACLLSSLALTALAAPRPQSYDFAELLADEPAVTEIVIPATATAATLVLEPSSAQSAVVAAATEISANIVADVVAAGGLTRRAQRNEACADESKGSGPVPSPNTLEGFTAAGAANGVLAGATDATPVPAGYTKVYTGANGQLPASGWYALKALATYDVQQCANYCSSFTACSSFNIFYERLPQQNPTCNRDTPSVTQIKCVAHGWNPTSADQATNKGGWRGTFKTATAGAAAYVQTYSTAPEVPGFTAPKTLKDGKCAINAPLDPEFKGVDDKYLDTYMGIKLFTNTPFDPSLCTNLCQETTTFNSKNVPKVANELYKTCNYVNVFMINKNSASQGMQCSMYSRDWKDKEDALAVNCGYTDTRWNDKYTITRATSYALSSTSRTDVAAPTKVPLLTFERDTFSEPDSVATQTTDTGILMNPVYGFNTNSLTGQTGTLNRAGAFFPPADGPLSQPAALGAIGICNEPIGCALAARDFTFDIKSLNFGDLAKRPGQFTIQGKRNGAVVATFQKMLIGGETILDNFTSALGDEWKNLDEIAFRAPLFSGFDNIDLVKTPRAAPKAIKARADGDETLAEKIEGLTLFQVVEEVNAGKLEL